MKLSMSEKYIIKNAIDLANPMLGTKIINCSDEFLLQLHELLILCLLFLKKMHLIIMVNGWMVGKQGEEDQKVTIIL